MKEWSALLLLVSLFVASFNASANNDSASKTAMPPFPLTAAEEADARAFAQAMLTKDAYHLVGVNLSEAHLGEVFLDITLRWRSIDDYRNSSEDDPRLFPGVLYYCFPVFVAGRQDALLAIVVVRNRDENRQPFHSFLEEGPVREEQYPQQEFIPFGYYMGDGQEGRTADAVRLRNQYGSRISFVTFLDQGLPLYVMVDNSTGILLGTMSDTLTSIQEGAPKIKSMLR